MSKALLRIAILSAPLLLTACGEGWEAQRTDSYLPYGNTRTAGTGVVYVRAKMLPTKELVVEPVMEEMKAEEPKAAAVDPVLQADEIFSEAQRKGSHVAVEKDAVVEEEKAQIVEEEAVPVEENSSSKEVAPDDGGDVAEEVEEEDHSSLQGSDIGSNQQTRLSSMTAEDYIAQAPKRILAPKVEVIKTSMTSDAEVMKTAVIDGYSDEVVEVYENVIAEPQKQIIVPKKDPNAYVSVGEETLDEIYNNPF